MVLLEELLQEPELLLRQSHRPTKISDLWEFESQYGWVGIRVLWQAACWPKTVAAVGGDDG